MYVDQTEFESGNGNCLAACLASILGLPLKAIPDLSPSGCASVNVERPEETTKIQDMAIVTFLERFGLSAVSMYFHANSDLRDVYFVFGGCPVIAWGDSPRHDNMSHAVLAITYGWGLKLLHDPHPSRVGVKGGRFTGMMLIVPLIPVVYRLAGKSPLVEMMNGVDVVDMIDKAQARMLRNGIGGEKEREGE